MTIKDNELWNTLLRLQKEGKLKPNWYYGNRSVVGSMDSIIAEDSSKSIYVNTTNSPDPDESELVNMVDMVINSAVRTIKSSREDRNSAMCQILDENGKTVDIYFSTYETERIISTEIRTNREPVPVPS